MKLRSSLIGALIIVLQAAALGLVTNAVRHDRLSMTRKPLSATRKVATKADLFPANPVVKQTTPQKPENGIEQIPTMLPATEEKPEVLSATPNKIPEIPVAPGTAVQDPQKIAVVPQIPKPASMDRPKPGKTPTRPVGPKKTTAQTPKPKKAEALFTTLTDAKALFDASAAVFLDARPKVDFDVEHIRGAKNLPEDEANGDYASVLGHVAKDATIVTYCSDPECRGAMQLADALVAKGYTRVFILLEGLPGWRDAGYPTEGALSR